MSGVETGIGATLREARNRRRVGLDEVEAGIKIRVRYLRAMENEDWELLPGGAYTRGFIRTYASYLGLDGDRLADEYRRSAVAGPVERPPRRVEPVASGSPRRRGRRLSGRALTVLVPLALVGLLVAIGLTGDDESSSPRPAAKAKRQAAPAEEARERRVLAGRPGVAVSLVATDEVWVCLLDGDEEPLVDGEILAPGVEAGPYRAESFSAAFGNGEVELTIDGRKAETPPSASPVGYRIDPGGELTPLEEGERPDCE